MIKRYSRPEMAQIWTDEAKFKAMLEVEVLTCESFCELGVIPKADYAKIKQNASFDIARILEIEEETKHDVVAFTRSISESLGKERRWIHYGLTSTDVVDTANGILIKRANEILHANLLQILAVLKAKAMQYKMTPCIGRTHGVHADITSFGLKWALYYDEFTRHLERFLAVRQEIEVGKISGAVGNFSNAPAFVQDYVCKHLQLGSVNISTQTLQRDRHANYLSLLALIATSIEKVCVELRHLQRTEVREVEETFSKQQKGSSAMPHKRNPITSENLSGCARVMRGYMNAAFDNICLWHERDISHSSVERIILPDATTLLDYMMQRFIKLVDNLVIFEDTMLKNIYLTNGVIFAQRFLNGLVDKGLSREVAYELVQPLAMDAQQNNKSFIDLVKTSAITEYLSDEEIMENCSLDYYLASVDIIFERVFK